MAKNQQFKYDLSIAMIVKNEEKYLERCLLALEPLRQSVNCELIITDTGSTDRTVEIAKNYADTFLTFEWCNDFAAARNTGLSRAKGRWFMFVDADEIADDSIVELIRFMKMENRDSFDNATINIINHKNEDANEQVQESFDASRLANLSKRKQEFTGALHETLQWSNNTFAIRTNFHHYGYTIAMQQKKLERNQEILDDMLEKTPNIMRVHQANINNQTNIYTKIALCEKAIELAKAKKLDDNETHFLTMQLVKYYPFVSRFAEFETLFDSYLATETRDILPKLEMIYTASQNYESEARTDKKVECYHAYLNTFKALEKKPDTQYMSMCPYTANTQHKFVEVTFLLASHYVECNELEKVIELLDDIRFERSKNVFAMPSRNVEYMALAMRSESKELIVRPYQHVKKSGAVEEVNSFINVLNDIYYTLGKGQKEVFHSAFSGEEDVFLAVNALRSVGYDFTKCTSKVLDMFDSERLVYETVLYADTFYATLLYKNDVLEFYKRSPYTFLKSAIHFFCEKRSDFLKVIYDKIENEAVWYGNHSSYFEKMVYAHLYYTCFMTQAIAIKKADRVEKPMLRQLHCFFNAYIETTVSYMQEIYTAEVLQQENVTLLQGVETFAFLMKDIVAKNEDAKIDLQILQNAIQHFPIEEMEESDLIDILKMQIADAGDGVEL